MDIACDIFKSISLNENFCIFGDQFSRSLIQHLGFLKNCWYICSSGFYCREIVITPGNGLVVTWQQTTAWTKHDQGPISLRLMMSHFRYHKSHTKIKVSKMHILQWMGSKFCVKFQRCPLKFHTKFWIHTRQNMHFTQCLNFDELRYLRVMES